MLLLEALAATAGGGGPSRPEGDGGALARLILDIGAYSGGKGPGGGRGGGGRGGGDERHVPGSLSVGNLGSRIFESLLSMPYKESGAALRSLADLPAAELLELARHPVGSRTVEAGLGAAGAALAFTRYCFTQKLL